MKISYQGKSILTLNIIQWPNNCGYLILQGYNFTYDTPKAVRTSQFVIDILSSLFPTYRKVLFTAHAEHSEDKMGLGKLSGVITVDKTFSKYNNAEENMIHMMSFDPATFNLSNLEAVARKHELVIGALSAMVYTYQEREAYINTLAHPVYTDIPAEHLKEIK